MQVQTILVPTDFSPHADQAFAAATELAARFGARIVLLHGYHAAIPTGAAGLGGGVRLPKELQDQISKLQEQLNKHQQAKDELKQQIAQAERDGNEAKRQKLEEELQKLERMDEQMQQAQDLADKLSKGQQNIPGHVEVHAVTRGRVHHAVADDGATATTNRTAEAARSAERVEFPGRVELPDNVASL